MFFLTDSFAKVNFRRFPRFTYLTEGNVENSGKSVLKFSSDRNFLTHSDLTFSKFSFLIFLTNS